MDKSHFYKEVLKEYLDCLNTGRKCFLPANDFIDIYYHFQDAHADIDAAICLKMALSLYPNNPDLLLTKAYELLDERKVEEAYLIVRNLEEQDSREVSLFYFEMELMRGNFKECNNIIEALSNNDMVDEDCMLEIAEIYLEHSYYLLAQRWLTEKSDSIEEKGKIYYQLLSETYYQLRAYADAEQCLNAAIDIDPYDDVLWTNLADTQLKQGLYEKTIESCDYALAINTEAIQAFRIKLEALMIFEPLEKVLETFEKAKFSTPYDYSIYRVLGYAYIQNHQEAEACTYLSKAYLLMPQGVLDYSDVVFYYAMCLYLNKQYDDALNLLVTLIGNNHATVSEIYMILMNMIAERGYLRESTILIDMIIGLEDYHREEYGASITQVLLKFNPEPQTLHELKADNFYLTDIWQKFLNEKYDPKDPELCTLAVYAWYLKHPKFNEIFLSAYNTYSFRASKDFSKVFPNKTPDQIYETLENSHFD